MNEILNVCFIDLYIVFFFFFFPQGVAFKKSIKNDLLLIIIFHVLVKMYLFKAGFYLFFSSFFHYYFSLFTFRFIVEDGEIVANLPFFN